jgi:UDP-N-acetylglucosamine:LPS N-acetylglucosamine transferase
VSAGPRILILTASIGEGHDLPARVLAEGIAEAEPGAEVEIADFLAICGGFIRRLVIEGSPFHSRIGLKLFDFEYKLFAVWKPTRRFASWGLHLVAGRRMRRAIEAARPDVIVSTYPGATELLGTMRRRGSVNVPVVSAITDLAALRWWAHPGVQLHLITHPESAQEVGEIAPGSEIACVRGLTDPGFYEPWDPAGARRALGLPAEAPVVLVSGGGWAVGDLGGAAEAALELPGATVVLLCGRSEAVRAALGSRFAGEPRVIVLGFSDRMPELMAAADVLVHSTAGLTVLEALMRGCRVISYGWGHAHIRVNNRAFERFGLARVASSREELAVALAGAVAEPSRPDGSLAGLPAASSAVLALARDAVAAA